MATAASRSTSWRTAGGVEDAGSSNRGRSRSLSRYSGRFPSPPPESDDFSTPRGSFVNKVRGSGFPEISLDDLADEFFRARAESESEEDSRLVARRSDRRISVASYRMETESSRRRGRSVSRPPDKGAVDGKATTGGNSRRQRSVSVARHRCTDSRNDLDLYNNIIGQTKWRSFGSGSSQHPSSQKPTNQGHALRRSMSQKDFFQSHDSYSSQSSSLTDDEAREVCSHKSETEKTIQAVYAPEKMEHPTTGDAEGTGLYEAMRKEVRHAVEEIKTELVKVMVKTEPTTILNDNEDQARSSNVIQVINDIRRNYTTKLEQSEKRKQELLAELAAEEQHGQELTKIVRELLPSPKQDAAPERPSRSRRRSNDRTRMSKHLTEEAERYFVDFLSNVEDADISSFDGEISDTSSTFRDLIVHNNVSETPTSLTKAAPLPVEADGVVLPWLQWETYNDTSSSPCKTKTEVPVISGNILPASAQEASDGFDSGKLISSNLGSWSPECKISRDKNGGRRGYVGNHRTSSDGAEVSQFDMDEYLALQLNEDLLFERLRQRHRIHSGSLILCGRTTL